MRALRASVFAPLQGFAGTTLALIAAAGLVSCGNAANDTTAPPAPVCLLLVHPPGSAPTLVPDPFPDA